MNQEKILSILNGLASGFDPITGEVLPDSSPYNHPEVIRALFHTMSLLPKVKKTKKTIEQKQQENIDKGQPKNYGLPWLDHDVNSVIEKYRSGISIDIIANETARKSSSIIGLLKKREVITEEQAFSLHQEFK